MSRVILTRSEIPLFRPIPKDAPLSGLSALGNIPAIIRCEYTRHFQRKPSNHQGILPTVAHSMTSFRMTRQSRLSIHRIQPQSVKLGESMTADSEEISISDGVQKQLFLYLKRDISRKVKYPQRDRYLNLGTNTAIARYIPDN